MKEPLSSEAWCETMCMISPPKNDSLRAKAQSGYKELPLFRETK